MKLVFVLLLITLISNNLSAVENVKLNAQPEIIFEYQNLKNAQSNKSLELEFNKAVLKLEQKEYIEAIKIFKKTAKILRVPSFLNIGIAYYKLESFYNANLYFSKIYEVEEIIYSDTYSYLSSAFYLYKMTKDRKYLEKIVYVGSKVKNLNDYSRRVLVDALIILEEYKKALEVLDTLDFPQYFKKALLYMELKDYVQAEIFLIKAAENTINKKELQKILWVRIYRDLKSNQLAKLAENLDKLNEQKSGFVANNLYPLKMYFNSEKYSSKDYLDGIIKFDEFRKIDFLLYFTPFVFSDNDEIIYDASKGFIFNSAQNLESLEQMVEYNSNFIEIMKLDPIVRIEKLKKLINYDTKSYVYYNLGLCYAHIFDYHNAYKYFHKAYKLNPGNKLFAVMSLITAKRVNIKAIDKDYIESNLISKKGLYKYFGQSLYKLLINPEIKLDNDAMEYENSILNRAILFIEDMNADKDLKESIIFKENYKDPVIYMLSTLQKQKDEKNFDYFSRLQDSIPIKLNQNFLEGPFLVTEFYIDILKAIGLFSRADFIIDNNSNPSYLRTKALKELYKGNPKTTISILDFLTQEYKFENKNSMYLSVAAMLSEDRYNDASVQISLIKVQLGDYDADFLTGVQLIQELKLSSASQFFKYPYKDSLIDFKLEGLEELLQSL